MGSPSGGERSLYPPLEPFRQTLVSVSSRHELYVEHSGNAKGFPVIFLHGGPGSQTRPDHRRYFDPDFYRIILFDQRGCGRSHPRGCTQENTIWHLVEDMERLRVECGASRWLVFGGSWGSTLALAYAIVYPHRVAAMVLRGIFLASRDELDWYLVGLRRFVPKNWETFADGTASDLLQRYQRDVNAIDRTLAVAAARRWVEYENSVMAIGASSIPAALGAVDEEALLARVRVQLHYLVADCFLKEEQLIQAAGAIVAPTIIVQGRSDMVCPPSTAFDLASRMPSAQLRMVEQAGHAASDPALAPELRKAADDMRSVLRGML